jgi:hypothetical protein
VIALSPIDASAFSRRGHSRAAALKKLERIYQHHDRKHELRASVLGIDPVELRRELKTAVPFETILKRHGFKDRLSYYIALTGRIKTELRERGWSERKFEECIQKRVARLSTRRSSRHVLAYT